ncbi:MAG: aminopeptidase [bacterium]|nr:aminopeptidase [bacterium]
MRDPRLDKLASVLINHSTRLQPGQTILIEVFDIPEEMVLALIQKTREAGGIPLVSLKNNRVQRELIQAGDAENMKQIAEVEAFRMERVQAYIGLRGSRNVTEMSDIPSEAMATYEQHWWNRVHSNIRVPKTNWVVLRWPGPSMAQQAQMSTEAFEDFYFEVCTLDYNKMERSVQSLQTLMDATEDVHITGPDTDFSFSIKDIPSVPCTGSHNIPDGECFTAPVRDSVNGTVHFNVPALYRGTVFSDICLEFEAGQIVNATANNTEKLNDILNSDEGARYIGEFAIGLNPYITSPMLDTLFDEKISGSFHFTPGQTYEETDNGNRSAVHWDMVFIQTPEYGGGEIYFDDTLIRKDGQFVLPELEGLNPENLK